MKLKATGFAALPILLAMTTNVFANDYYVNVTTGSDSNAGTLESPWKTIQHCIASFTLGSTGAVCHIAQGSYNYPGGQSCYGGEGPSVCISRGGTSAAARLTLQCDSQWTVPSFGRM